MTQSAAICAALAAFALSGCIMYQGERTPDLVGEGVEVDVTGAPRIDLVLRHRHTMDGSDQGTAVGMSFDNVRDSFRRVKQEFPFLANSEIDQRKPEFVLEVETEIAESGGANAFISGLTLLIIPHIIRSDVIVTGSLSRPGGEKLGSYRATGRMRGAMQILLILALPALPFTNPGNDLFDDTFRDFFIQVGQRMETELDQG